MKNSNEKLPSDQYLKPRRLKSREVSSRFLSPTSSPSHHTRTQSPTQTLSPELRRKSTSTDTQNQQLRCLEDSTSFRGLWPSSSHSSTHKLDTLADHLDNERLNDFLQRKNHEISANSVGFLLARQRSCAEFSRFPSEKKSTKENHRASLGGSMRYTGKVQFPAKTSSSSSSSSSSNSLCNNNFVPGRLSVDENMLYRKSSQRKSDSLVDNLKVESESENSAVCSATDSTGSPSLCRRKYGVEASSKYLHDISARHRRVTSDSNISNPVSAEYSPRKQKFSIKSAIKRTNSLTGYGSSVSQWALSPGRSGSPPISVETKARSISFSSLKPPSSPSRAKRVEKLFNKGLELFKTKKSSSSSPVPSYDVETVHQLKQLHNRLIVWRFANARADGVNLNITNQTETSLLRAGDTLKRLQLSVQHKKIRLQKEKLEMKLAFLLQSQIKLLETWGDIERQHVSAVSMTRECLHSVVCRVPLIEGAKVDLQLASITLSHASDLSGSIMSILTTFSPSAEKNNSFISELAEVVSQEKLLLEECLELLRTISVLEIQERSLKCYIIQFNLWQQLLHEEGQREQQEEETLFNRI